MVRVGVLIALLLLATAHAQDSINVAVTASFKPVLENIVETYQQDHDIRINLSSASTGILYQQILSGAPFDIFFAADADRPKILQQALNLPDETVSTYAFGQLVLFSKNDQVSTVNDLRGFEGRLVIANPALAPYGIAAQQVLDYVTFDGARVMANNVAQARQYLELGLADVGLIAESISQGLPNTSSLDANLYDAIQQDVLLISQSEVAIQFLRYVQQQGDVLRDFGYEPASTL